MSKELEALERLVDDALDIRHYYKQFSSSTPIIMQDKELIESALKRLEKFESSHLVVLPRMSGKKSLVEDYEEALAGLTIFENKLKKQKHWNKVCEDRIATLETINKKQDEILRIIKEKRVNTDYFWKVLRAFKVHKGKVQVWGKTWTDPLEYYNEHLFYREMGDPEVSKYLKKKYYLTQEEFDLLKEGLCGGRK